jgi:uncharacterized protein (TIGR02996 family)
MTDAQALLLAVCADPDNIGLRLVYADFLEERGDPRADFIRVQCELANLDEDEGEDRRTALEEQELALLNRHGSAWVNELELGRQFCKFRRGFVEFSTMGAAEFLASAERLLSATPLCELYLTHVGSEVDALAASPQLARLARLWVGVINDTETATLCASPHLSNLKALTLAGGHLGLDGMRALLASPALEGLHELRLQTSERMGATELELFAQDSRMSELRVLRLHFMQLGAAGVQALAASRRLVRLHTLELKSCAVSDAGIDSLARSHFLPCLIHLHLSNNNIGSGALHALANTPRPSRLQTLDLSGNTIGIAGVRALAGSPHLAGLRQLSLRSCRLSTAAVKVLASSFGDSLRSLTLGRNPIGHEGAEHLAQAPRLAGLRELEVSGCGLTAWSVKALTWSPHLVGLRTLCFGEDALGDDALLALGACPARPHLKTLSLRGCGLTDDGLGSVRSWANLPALVHLDLAINNIGDMGARRLADSPLLQKLVHLDLSNTAVTSEGVRVILASERGRRLQSLALESVSLDDETRAMVRARFFGQSYLRW